MHAAHLRAFYTVLVVSTVIPGLPTEGIRALCPLSHCGETTSEMQTSLCVVSIIEPLAVHHASCLLDLLRRGEFTLAGEGCDVVVRAEAVGENAVTPGQNRFVLLQHRQQAGIGGR
jgi:hypothetical protein